MSIRKSDEYNIYDKRYAIARRKEKKLGAILLGYSIILFFILAPVSAIFFNSFGAFIVFQIFGAIFFHIGMPLITGIVGGWSGSI